MQNQLKLIGKKSLVNKTTITYNINIGCLFVMSFIGNRLQNVILKHIRD